MRFDPRLYSDRQQFMVMVGCRIKSAMHAKGMGYRTTAMAAGISESSLNGYIVGRHEPSAWAICSLAEVLCVTADWLLGLDGEGEEDGESHVNRGGSRGRVCSGNQPGSTAADAERAGIGNPMQGR